MCVVTIQCWFSSVEGQNTSTSGVSLLGHQNAAREEIFVDGGLQSTCCNNIGNDISEAGQLLPCIMPNKLARQTRLCDHVVYHVVCKHR